MAIKAMYNVGAVTVGGTQKNLFYGSSDGQPFLFKLNGSGFDYLTADYVRSQMALQNAVVDARLDLSAMDNTLAPSYSTAPADGLDPFRQLAITNVGALSENYVGAPYYTLKGDGVADYTADTFVGGQNFMSSDTAAPGPAAATTPTGIAAVDGVINFAMNNIIWIVLAIVGLAYLGIFDPFGLFKKKGKKAKK